MGQMVAISEDDAVVCKRQQAQMQYEAELAREARRTAEENAQRLIDEMSYQGNAVSMFSVVATIFLPLAFFTQVGTYEGPYLVQGTANWHGFDSTLGCLIRVEIEGERISTVREPSTVKASFGSWQVHLLDSSWPLPCSFT